MVNDGIHQVWLFKYIELGCSTDVFTMLSIGEWDVVECFMFVIVFVTLTSDGFSFNYLRERKLKAYIIIVRRQFKVLVEYEGIFIYPVAVYSKVY